MINMFKSLFNKPILTEYEQKMLDIKKYNMKHYGTTSSPNGYTPLNGSNKGVPPNAK